jgi:hypothetical protein
MEEKYIQKLFLFLGIVLLLLVGASLGALYADNNNKNDILKASNHEDKPTYLSFNLDGLTYYFLVTEITPNNYRDYVNMTLINDSVNKTNP